MGSRSDQLFHKRQLKGKEKLKRDKSILEENERVLIVCEGKITEPNYFNFLSRKLGLLTAQVEIYGSCGSAPKNVVEFGIKKFDENKNFDHVYFVFDKDTHTTYDYALTLVEGLRKQRKFKNIFLSAITSCPCFEFWFLLHFGLTTKPYHPSGSKSPCDNLISDLKKKPYFNDYEKNQKNYFNFLHDRLPNAKINSERALDYSLSVRDRKHFGNPTTFVHILVDNLEKLAEKQSKIKASDSKKFDW